MYQKKLLFFYFIILYIILVEIAQGTLRPKLISIEDCKVPSSEIDNKNALDHYIQAKKINRYTVLMFGNITVPRKMGPFTHNIRSYRVQRSTVRDLEFHFDKLSCHNPVIQQILNFIKIKYDEDCYAYPNTYKIDNLNIDELTGLLADIAVVPGQYAYDLEFLLDKEVVICVSLLVNMATVKTPK